MIIFDGFQLIGLAIMICLLLLCGVAFIIDRIVYAIKKRRQKKEK